MPIPLFIIDTFTAKAFAGNPTAVCLPEENPGAAAMLAIAAELNLPVTAFVQPLPNGGDYAIKYFTPTTEIPACGHATLAAAQVVSTEHNRATANFFAAGEIVIAAVSEGDLTRLTYPKFELRDFAVTAETLKSLQIETFESVGICPELEALFVELGDEDLLRTLEPDFARMVESTDEIKEIVVTCKSSRSEYDYLLRSFCPWIGIDEDPVTGSVHSVLAGFWSRRLGKNELTAYQASARGGELFVTAGEETIGLGGRSVVIIKGEIVV